MLSDAGELPKRKHTKSELYLNLSLFFIQERLQLQNAGQSDNFVESK
jgi:hypothetical protein